LYFSRKFLLHKYLRKLFCKTKITNLITNCYYSTYNGTVVGGFIKFINSEEAEQLKWKPDEDKKE